MTVTVDVATKSVRTGTEDPHTFSHLGGAGPKGVIVTTQHGNEQPSLITGVTYGGVALSKVREDVDTAVEPGATQIWFLGASVPTGTQTVSIANGTSNRDMFFMCLTLDGADDLEVIDSDGLGDDQADPQVTLQYAGRTAMAFDIIHHGAADPTDLTNVADTTRVGAHDYGTRVGVMSRQTTAGSSDFTIGYTAASDDVAYTAVAVSEVVSGGATVDPYPYVGGGYFPTQG